MDFSNIELTADNFRDFKYQYNRDHYFEWISESRYVTRKMDQETFKEALATWHVDFQQFKKHFKHNGWKIIGFADRSFCGPMPLPPPPIVLKIREMYKRQQQRI